ncbi:hypothetical protein NBRC3257_1017 [Gluconobacter thailandicus NBRC 3257]|uniref:Uncharacterized protein n=1 Tax=Gluconobacter thailandicus NBRC 3257 TaxID=1381097 RepID=A0ABQ0IUX4_GLUTH|nr:hypothetical protein B932_1442 [Gluconobacter oxydans H24]GAC86456.1 hypothetical protein NBRC3255_0117 [Gluconobacter thailandicus NBRC 3255]GAD26018.1 hypothetical protein NBRC3257_1017 [Gluconobacter thailandicus NBRC 3257]
MNGANVDTEKLPGVELPPHCSQNISIVKVAGVSFRHLDR